MIQGSSSYNPNGAVNTDVSGSYNLTSPGQGLYKYVTDRLNQIRRFKNQQAMMAGGGGGGGGGGTRSLPTPGGPTGERSMAETDALRAATAAKQAQAQAATAQAMAVSQPPPMHWVYPGGQPLLEPDIDRMTGAQRQMFLPQNSANDPAKDAYANKTAADDWSREMAGIENQWKETGGMI